MAGQRGLQAFDRFSAGRVATRTDSRANGRYQFRRLAITLASHHFDRFDRYSLGCAAPAGVNDGHSISLRSKNDNWYAIGKMKQGRNALLSDDYAVYFGQWLVLIGHDDVF